jgi:hypothetical protein
VVRNLTYELEQVKVTNVEQCRLNANLAHNIAVLEETVQDHYRVVDDWKWRVQAEDVQLHADINTFELQIPSP